MVFDTRPSSFRRFAPIIVKRILLAGLLLIAYLVVLRPARSWIASEVMKPALSRVDTARSDRYSVHSKSTIVEVYRIGSSDRVTKTKPPIGGVFILVGILFITMSLHYSYWLYIVPYQLGLCSLMFGMMVIGVGWADWGFTICEFFGGNFYKGTSFAIPLLLLRADGKLLFADIIPDVARSEMKD